VLTRVLVPKGHIYGDEDDSDDEKGCSDCKVQLGEEEDGEQDKEGNREEDKDAGPVS